MWILLFSLLLISCSTSAPISHDNDQKAPDNDTLSDEIIPDNDVIETSEESEDTSDEDDLFFEQEALQNDADSFLVAWGTPEDDKAGDFLFLSDTTLLVSGLTGEDQDLNSWDGLVLTIDIASGQQLDHHQYGTTGRKDQFGRIVGDENFSRFLTGGQINSIGEERAALLLFDSEWNEQWEVAWDGEWDTMSYVGLILLHDDEIIVAGRYSDRPLVAKLDWTGTVLWEKQLPFYGGFFAMELNSKEQIVLVGAANADEYNGGSLPDVELPPLDPFFVVVDQVGEVVLSKIYEQEGSYVTCMSATLLPDDSLLFLSTSTAPACHSYLVDSSGDLLAHHILSDKYDIKTRCGHLLRTDSGRLFMSGQTSGDVAPTALRGLAKINYDFILAELTEEGDIEWLKRYGGSGQEHPSMMKYRNNALYLLGWSDSPDFFPNHSTGDYYIFVFQYMLQE